MTAPPAEARRLAPLREAARARALELGFSLAGFTSADPLDASVQGRWRRWLASGRAGAMTYLLRARPRRTHPRDLLPQARSAIVVAASYYDGDHPPRPERGESAEEGHATEGKVARYAWGRDYHGVLRERLARLGVWIEGAAAAHGHEGPVLWRAVTDSAPLDERALARRAGLGFIGKNTLLIHPGHGSWMLLGVLLTSVPLPEDAPMRDPAATCGSCRRCLEACPTGAFEAPWNLDPRRCISYLTIEQKEPIPAELAARMEGWAFGCDACQEVCPFNESPARRAMPELAAERGIGPYVSASDVESPESNKAFLRRWGHTPLERPGRPGMRRNLETIERASSIVENRT